MAVIRRHYLIYFILTFTILGLIIFIREISNSESFVLSFSEIIIAFIVPVFATLWKRNQPLVVGIFFYLINFNIDLFKKMSNNFGNENATVRILSIIQIISLAVYIPLFIIGIFEVFKSPIFKKEIDFKDGTLMISIVIITIISQILLKVYCA